MIRVRHVGAVLVMLLATFGPSGSSAATVDRCFDALAVQFAADVANNHSTLGKPGTIPGSCSGLTRKELSWRMQAVIQAAIEAEHGLK